MRDFTIDDLRFLVSEFGVETKSTKKDVLLEALIDAGITSEAMAEALENKAKVSEPTFEKKDPVVLIKMNRQNPTFAFRGYKFTSTHPFVLMKEDDATAILIHEVGFSRANVQDAEEYYGRS